MGSGGEDDDDDNLAVRFTTFFIQKRAWLDVDVSSKYCCWVQAVRLGDDDDDDLALRFTTFFIKNFF